MSSVPSTGALKHPLNPAIEVASAEQQSKGSQCRAWDLLPSHQPLSSGRCVLPSKEWLQTWGQELRSGVGRSQVPSRAWRTSPPARPNSGGQLAQLQRERVTAGHLHQQPPGAKPLHEYKSFFPRMLARGVFHHCSLSSRDAVGRFGSSSHSAPASLAAPMDAMCIFSPVLRP